MPRNIQALRWLPDSSRDDVDVGFDAAVAVDVGCDEWLVVAMYRIVRHACYYHYHYHDQ